MNDELNSDLILIKVILITMTHGKYLLERERITLNDTKNKFMAMILSEKRFFCPFHPCSDRSFRTSDDVVQHCDVNHECSLGK